jgi:WD40 repeat protein
MPGPLPPLTLKPVARPNPVTGLAASPWAPLLAVSGHDRIVLYDLAKNTRAGELAFPEGIPYALRFSRDGEILLAAGGRPVQSGKVVLFDVRTGKRIAVIGDEKDLVLSADLSPDGKLVALGGPSKVVRVYSVPEARLVYELKKHTDWITAIEFSPDGTRLATGDRSGAIYLWESAAGGTLGALADHKDSITALSWRGDSQLLASASEDGQVIVWNALDGFPLATIKAHQKGVLAVQFTSDGRIASTGRDSVTRLWTPDGKPRGASPPFPTLPTKLSVSPDGKTVIVGDYAGTLHLWSGQSLSTL